MDILHIATPYLEQHGILLEKVYLTVTAVLATVMLTASLVAVFSPSTMSNNAGLPLIPPSYSEKNKAVFGHLQASTRTIQGWILLFACREFTIGVVTLLLNRFGLYQALSLLVQVSYVCGLMDSFAAWQYGVPGGYKMHFYPTIAAVWVGPLGLWLYWR